MRVLPACWKTLLRIENISLGDPYLWRAQHQCATFPHLRCCTLSASDGRWTSTEHKDTLASFLTRHPALESIRIQETPSFGSWPLTSALISLPALRRLRAPRNFPVSIANSRLTEFRLSFGNSGSVGATFSSLRSLTRIEVPFICGIDCLPHHCEKILDSVSTHIPHTRILQMEMFLITYTDPTLTEVFAFFVKCLARFSGLEIFFFVETDRPQISGVSDSDVEGLATRIWADIRSNRHCRFQTRVLGGRSTEPG
ncbi:hypothetical protein DFH08DRAFT_211122 [Mycena albidolilacea]|uniref:Uncharacterized protein n=1 Tax=Mycena albidolilacea TaxID=1033008 RepID=A0AAD7EQZ5_9AGAR|nr:hypothetical protein DFH08DRAFT_211122 [Mycena albidolilacea]